MALPIEYSELPFNIQVALSPWKDRIKTVERIVKFGQRSGIAASTDTDIWQGATAEWVAPTVAQPMTVESASSEDDGSPTGNGAWSIRVDGLDPDGDPITHDVIMNGLTTVDTPDMLIVNRAFVLPNQFGSAGKNVGKITIKAKTDGTEQCIIPAGYGQSSRAIYTVPAGHVLYLDQYTGSISRSGNASATVDISVFRRIYGSGVNRGWNASGSLSSVLDGSSAFRLPGRGQGFPPLTDVKMAIRNASHSATAAAGIFGGLLFKLAD